MIIKNHKQLLKNSSGRNKLARSYALELIDAGINSILPREVMKNSITLDGNILKIKDKEYDLGMYKKIIVIGGGKASGLMAEELEKILGKRIYSGAVNDHIGQKKTRIVKITKAGHPIPNENGVKGVKKMLSLVEELSEDDLVIALISGGGSALMTAPVDGVSLKDLQKMNDILLKSGAEIHEINCVRKHLSLIKGGKLVENIYPAKCISLIFSDVVGDDLNAIASGCTVGDPTRYKDVLKIIKKYNMDAPKSILNHLEKGVKGEIKETPKPRDKIFKNVGNILLANLPTALEAVKERAFSLRLKPRIVTAKLTGEARIIGERLAKKAIRKRSGTVLIYGGETTVTVKGDGIGGRNQELCLGALEKLKGKNCAIISAGSDGRDGPTDADGAIVDGLSFNRSVSEKLDAKAYLENNDAYHFFKKMDDLLITGPTGTNVADLMISVTL
ncbi:glycerate kinase [Candidatus Woesearchaeota archaeon]|nr:glycerate kinase [Candidatus Woesearchaeota archaeon]